MSCLWNICSLNTYISTENSLGTCALMKFQTTELEKVILSFLLNWLWAYFSTISVFLLCFDSPDLP